MADYNLISCDLDGTLLRNDMSISEENLNAISNIANDGVFFVLNTGRTYSQIPSVLRNDPNIRYTIYSNGAVVYDKLTGEHISACMPQEISNKALDILFKYDIKMIVHYQRGAYVDAAGNETRIYSEEYRWPKNYCTIIAEGGIPCENFEKTCREMDGIEMFCVFFRHDDEMLECKSRFESTPEFRVTSSATHNIEIFYEKATKGTALTALAKKLDVDMENTIAVGDSLNDLSQLSVAGLAIATDNALPELKEMADLVSVSNEEHAVEYIYENVIKAEDTEPTQEAQKVVENADTPRKKTNKNFVLLIVAIALATVIFGTLISGFFGFNSTTKLGYVGNQTFDSWSATYAYLDGTMRHTLIPDSGMLHMSIKTKSGILNVTIKDSDGNVVFDMNNIETGTYDVEIDGKAYVTIEAEGHKGSFVIGD